MGPVVPGWHDLRPVITWSSIDSYPHSSLCSVLYYEACHLDVSSIGSSQILVLTGLKMGRNVSRKASWMLITCVYFCQSEVLFFQVKRSVLAAFLASEGKMSLVKAT